MGCLFEALNSQRRDEWTLMVGTNGSGIGRVETFPPTPPTIVFTRLFLASASISLVPTNGEPGTGDEIRYHRVWQALLTFEFNLWWKYSTWKLVSYAAGGGALRDETKNGCVGDYLKTAGRIFEINVNNDVIRQSSVLLSSTLKMTTRRSQKRESATLSKAREMFIRELARILS